MGVAGASPAVYSAVMMKVQGQNRAIAQLQRAMANGRLGHTWVFAGPYGVGKFTLAVELAKTRLCDAPVKRRNEGALPQLPAEFELTFPCEACESCRAIMNGSHPDLHIVTRQLIRFHDASGKSMGTTLSINVIRGEITGDPEEGKEAKIAKRSFRGRGKWFIIDEADLMETAAQNSLLKTLEEPPPESYLVLITTSPQELLSTIRSRSQTVLFNALPMEVIVPGLVGRGMSEGDAALLARLSSGSLGRSMLWAQDMETAAAKNAKDAEKKAKRAAKDLDEDEAEEARFTPGGILAWAGKLGEALDGLVNGTVFGTEVGALMLAFADEYAALQVMRDERSSKAQAGRDGMALILGMAADWFADRLRQGLGAPLAVTLPAATAGMDPVLARELIEAARRAEQNMDSNANTKLVASATGTAWERLVRG